jgi:hypothetical protein
LRTRALSIAHRGDRRLIPIEVRPDVRASLPAALANEPALKIGKPDVIRPSVRADRDRVAAMEIRAVDQDPAHTGGAHLSEGDLLRAGEGGHARLKRDAPQ